MNGFRLKEDTLSVMLAYLAHLRRVCVSLANAVGGDEAKELLMEAMTSEGETNA